jgi:hypothetical protein
VICFIFGCVHIRRQLKQQESHFGSITHFTYSILVEFKDGNKRIFHDVGSHKILGSNDESLFTGTPSTLWDGRGKVIAKIPFNLVEAWSFINSSDYSSNLEFKEMEKILDFIVKDPICWINAPPDVKLSITKLRNIHQK